MSSLKVLLFRGPRRLFPPKKKGINNSISITSLVAVWERKLNVQNVSLNMKSVAFFLLHACLDMEMSCVFSVDLQ